MMDSDVRTENVPAKTAQIQEKTWRRALINVCDATSSMPIVFRTIDR
jgi:hypothetical protein